MIEHLQTPLMATRRKTCVIGLFSLLFLWGCSDSSSPDLHSQSGELVDDPVVEPMFNPITDPEILNASLTPIVRLSEDREFTVGDLVTLKSTVILKSMPVAQPSVLWEVLSGPGSAAFSDVAAQETQLSVDLAGKYVIKMTAFNGSYVSSDTQVITALPAIANKPPVVNAGRNTTVTLGSVLGLAGVVEDDGTTQVGTEIRWEKYSGPGTVIFEPDDQAQTSVTFGQSGTYVLVLLADDGEYEIADRIQVIVNDAHTAEADISGSWDIVSSSNGSKPTARHEAGGLGYKNQFYLIGGRGKRPVDRYNPSTRRWDNLGTPSMEMHHFQPVEFDGKIYVIGALECCYPAEKVVPKIKIFNPDTKKWSDGPSIPKNRLRGSAGVVVYNNRIYMVGGSTNGHDGGTVNWFDEYNPATKQWKTLKNAPTKRDHFSAVVIGNRLIAAGGRQTDYPDTFSNLVSAVDVYNFKTKKWETGIPGIPTQRAGAVVTAVGDEVMVIGGETAKAGPALKTVEAYNVATKKWRKMKSINVARHSGGIARLNDAIHIASGNTRRGGGSETTSHEKLDLK